ncbi:MAG: hypothetical protein AB1483_04165 [Candidatus Zixiibacteriota bacterium]
MSYTNIELVRRYLGTPYPAQSNVRDQAVIMRGTDDLVFYGGAVDESSLVVKGVVAVKPVRVNLNLTALSTRIVNLPLVPGSVLVASDSSLGTIFTEGTDYSIDYANSSLLLKESGLLGTGQTVVVWYMTYRVYVDGVDYHADYDRGSIRRLPSGDICDGESVYIDYSPLLAGYIEEMIIQAVADANALIEAAVDPEGQFGADIALQAAATYRALEIVGRATAAKELLGLNKSDKAALAWMKLGDHFAERSEQLLSSFRAPYTGPAAPVKN